MGPMRTGVVSTRLVERRQGGDSFFHLVGRGQASTMVIGPSLVGLWAVGRIIVP